MSSSLSPPACGMKLYGSLRVHWQMETDSLDKLSAINMKLMEDKAYWAMLEQNKDLWLAGSLKDTVVLFPN